MRHWITVILLGLMMGACGGNATTAPTTTAPDSSTTATSEATTTSTIAVTTTTTSLPPSLSGENPVPDRSILSLGLEDGETRPGRFRLVPGPITETLRAVEGRYWVTEPGNVYTALDIDLEVVAEQMALLTAATEAAGGQPIDSPYLTSLREHYRGDEFQIGLADLVRSLAVGGVSAEWAEQWSWFVRADGNPVPPELMVCANAITSLDEAARNWVRDLDIDFSDGTWAFPIEDFEEALMAHLEEASICEQFIDPAGPSPEVVIRVSGEPGLRRVDVLVDDKIYTDREPELMFALVMWPDESVGPPPAEPDPASLLTLRGSYLTAIGVCGELPWIYSNFAAANTFYGPGDGGYPGPIIFASGWFCEDEVPQERRNEGG